LDSSRPELNNNAVVQSALGGILARFGLFGFGSKLEIARHVLRVGKALRSAFDRDGSEAARTDLQDWLSKHDPRNETGLGQGVVELTTVADKQEAEVSAHVSSSSN
jgi:hypothetical protein